MNPFTASAETATDTVMGAAVVAVAKKTKIAGERKAPLAERGVR